MRKLNWAKTGVAALVLALSLIGPSLSGHDAAVAKTKAAAKAGDDSAAAGSSKEDQDKIKEHNKLRDQIKKVKYPAAKAVVVAKVKGIKADDKKWFEETLPDKTYNSADEVYSALGWETAPAGETK